ncbi:MAG: ribonuclease J [Clostridia bacterium]|nr:ribonuclease J [Clostridia bacterium]
MTNEKKTASKKRAVKKTPADFAPEKGAQKPAKRPGTKKPAAKKAAKKPKEKLRIVALGGLDEIGRNLTVIEYGKEMLIFDCGLGFPDDDMLGVDLVIPDFTYIRENRDKLRALFLTHGHEDHIGALPYFLRDFHVPVYGTKLTLGILENKLPEHRLEVKPDLNCISAGERITTGSFEVEAIRVNHSIPDSLAFAVRTPAGTVVLTGDFKIDLTPIDGEMTDLTRFGEIGREGVKVLLCESTNAERAGYTPSERTVGRALEEIFHGCKKRVVIATFSSNVHRVQQIIDTSVRYGRKVAVMGRSMTNILSAARELGYIRIPEGVLIDVEEMRAYRPGQITLITTGSQGEPMSALSRMAFGSHTQVSLGVDDLVVISANPIPGNDRAVGRIINELLRNHVNVVYSSVADVHVSGHACQEEIRTVMALLKPKYLIPVHGEYKHRAQTKLIGTSLGIPEKNIPLLDIGQVVEVSDKEIKVIETAPAGKLLVDGSGVGDVGAVVLRDRRALSQEGLVAVVIAADIKEGYLMAEPEIATRGFVYVKESQDLIDEMRYLVRDVADDYLFNSRRIDENELKNKVRDELSRFLFSKTRRRPVVLPIVIRV